MARAVTLYMAGSGLVAIWLFQNTPVGFFDSMVCLFSALGNALLISTVSADLQITLIGSSWQQLQDLRNSELEGQLEARVHDLKEAQRT